MGKEAKRTKCPQCDSFIAEDSQYCSKCGLPIEEKQDTLTYTPAMEQGLDDTLSFDPGDSFGPRYRIIEEIGRGGMGRVYKAKDKELGITVALKMIRPVYSSNPLFIQRFKEETLLARSISHENVIRIHDLGEVDDIKFISMDYIKGHDLKELIQTSGPLSVERAVSIAKQIYEGLKAAHHKHIVHLDLKLRNIMIDHDGRVNIMDFGVARSIEAHEIEPSKTLIGTLPYISPEQAKGEKVDHRADIYSVGIILFEMLTGKRPFEADTSSAYLEKHIKERPPSPSEFNPFIPPFLEKIILRSLEKDRNSRYQRVEEILKDLEEHKEESGVYLTKIKAKKIGKLAFVVFFALLLAFGIYLLVGIKKPVSPLVPEGGRIPLVVMHFENNTGDESLENWRQALPNMIIYDLLQSKYIRVLTGDTLFSILEQLDLLDVKNFSSEDLRKVALRGGANHVLYGNYTKAEKTFRIDAMLKNVITGAPVNSIRVQGEGDKTFMDAADQLTPWVKSQFKIGTREIAADFDKEVRKITTNSPEAWQLYLQGKRYYNMGKYKESTEVLEKAIEIDNGFALPYKRISENYHYLYEMDQAFKYAQQALSLIDRVSVRDRYLIQGWAYTILEDSYKKAIENYKEMLQYYPDDEEGNIYLGAIYRNLEDWDLALERFNKIFEFNPSIASINIVRFHMAKGLYDKALEFVKANQDNYISKALYHLDQGLIYLFQKRYDLALVEIRTASSLDPDYYMTSAMMGHAYQIQNELQEAEIYYQPLLTKDDQVSKFHGRFWLAHLYLARGQFENCKKEIIQGITESRKYNLKPGAMSLLMSLTYLSLLTRDLDKALEAVEEAQEIASEIKDFRVKILIVHLRGLIQLQMNKVNEAKDTAEKLKDLIEKTGFQKLMRYCYHLRGMIDRNENMNIQAIKDFEKAISLLPYQFEMYDEHAFFLYPLALSYYQLEEMEPAQRQFENIIDLATGRLMRGDLYAKSYYWLGKIFQHKGWTGKAIENYEKFLQVWVKADPGIPEKEDARKQLLLLKQGSRE